MRCRENGVARVGGEIEVIEREFRFIPEKIENGGMKVGSYVTVILCVLSGVGILR